MCGIAALVCAGSRDLAKRIGAMTRLVRHRGPDDEGYALFAGARLAPTILGGDDTPQHVWSSGLAHAPRSRLVPEPAEVAMGHRRLSIIDLSASGHQPMCSADGRYWIVFNGEIYNYIELRTELAALGYRFVSTSDTEVILAAWSQWGPNCLQRFNGMFALVLLDRHTSTLYAVRDRFGVKPLYWWRPPGGGLALASEIKQFTTLPGWRARADAQMSYDYLVWGLFDHTRYTLFDGVGQLRGGEMLALSIDEPIPSRIEPIRWYELKPRTFRGARKDAVELFKQTFTDAVRLRLRSDVPIGSCLSGGLDSSSIVCVGNRLLVSSTGSQKVFTAVSSEARFDESRYARAVIEATGAEAHFVSPEPDDLFQNLDEITWTQDEPFGSSSIYAQWRVFQLAAAASVKVVLDGQGADEQLAGYPGFLRPLLISQLRRGQVWSFARELMAAGRSTSLGYAYALQQLANGLLPEALRQRLRALAGRPVTGPAWLDMRRLGAIDREPLAAEYAAADTLTALSQLLLLQSGVPMLLHTEDRNSMVHSVESRVPFLDFRLVETVLGMPDEFKLCNGTTKVVLREAMHGILPESVRLRRDKLGFATAEETWLRGASREAFRAGVVRCIEASGGIVKPDALARFDRVAGGAARFDFGIWRLVNFGTWIRRFGVGIG